MVAHWVIHRLGNMLYVNGMANTIKTNIETIWLYTLNQINFNIDRFTVNKSTTYNWENKLTPPWSRTCPVPFK
jgi:hypothetical protein